MDTSRPATWMSLCLCCCSVPASQLKFETYISKAFLFCQHLAGFWCNNVTLGAEGRRGWEERGPLLLFIPLRSLPSSFLLCKKVSSSFSEKFSCRKRLSRSLTGINVFVIHKISHIVTSCTFFISVVWNIKMLKRFYTNVQIINAVHETVPVITV